MTTKEQTMSRVELLEKEKSTLLRVNALLEQIIEAQGLALEALRVSHISSSSAVANAIEFGGVK